MNKDQTIQHLRKAIEEYQNHELHPKTLWKEFGEDFVESMTDPIFQYHTVWKNPYYPKSHKIKCTLCEIPATILKYVLAICVFPLRLLLNLILNSLYPFYRPRIKYQLEKNIARILQHSQEIPLDECQHIAKQYKLTHLQKVIPPTSLPQDTTYQHIKEGLLSLNQEKKISKKQLMQKKNDTIYLMQQKLFHAYNNAQIMQFYCYQWNLIEDAIEKYSCQPITKKPTYTTLQPEKIYQLMKKRTNLIDQKLTYLIKTDFQNGLPTLEGLLTTVNWIATRTTMSGRDHDLIF